MDAFVQHATRTEQGRTAKSCGPGAAMLAPSLAGGFPQGDGDNKPAHRGEHEISRKAIAQGMSVCSPLTCMLVCAIFAQFLAHETAGAARTRHSLRPLFERGTTNLEKLGRKHAARIAGRMLSPRRPGEAKQLRTASRDPYAAADVVRKLWSTSFASTIADGGYGSRPAPGRRETWPDFKPSAHSPSPAGTLRDSACWSRPPRSSGNGGGGASPFQRPALRSASR